MKLKNLLKKIFNIRVDDRRIFITILGITIRRTDRRENFEEIKINYNATFKKLTIKSGCGWQDYNQNTIILFWMMFNKFRDEFKKSFKIKILSQDFIPDCKEKYLGYSIKKDDKKSMFIPDPTFFSWVNCGCDNFNDYVAKIETRGGVDRYTIKSFG